MQRKKLSIDDLKVESFDVSPTDVHYSRGTVVGHAVVQTEGGVDCPTSPDQCSYTVLGAGFPECYDPSNQPNTVCCPTAGWTCNMQECFGTNNGWTCAARPTDCGG